MQSKSKKSIQYMNTTPMGYRLRMGHLPLAVNPRSKIGFGNGQWSESKAMIHRKLSEAIKSGDEKRQLQMYKLLVLMIENNQYSNFLNGFDTEFKMPKIPDFKEAIQEFKKRMM